MRGGGPIKTGMFVSTSNMKNIRSFQSKLVNSASLKAEVFAVLGFCVLLLCVAGLKKKIAHSGKRRRRRSRGGRIVAQRSLRRRVVRVTANFREKQHTQEEGEGERNAILLVIFFSFLKKKKNSTAFDKARVQCTPLKKQQAADAKKNNSAGCHI